MSIEREQILKRVRKCLALANGAGAAEGEIANAMAAARKLMDENNIREHELQTADNTQATHVAFVDAWSKKQSFTIFAVDLAQVVQTLLDVRVLMVRIGEQRILRFYGCGADAVIASNLYSELMATAKAMSRFACGTGWTPAHRSYMEGFASRLQSRAREYRKISESAVVTGGLVLAKLAKVDAFLDSDVKPKDGEPQKRKGENVVGAWMKGAGDANNINLDPNRRDDAELNAAPQRKLQSGGGR